MCNGSTPCGNSVAWGRRMAPQRSGIWSEFVMVKRDSKDSNIVQISVGAVLNRDCDDLVASRNHSGEALTIIRRRVLRRDGVLQGDRPMLG